MEIGLPSFRIKNYNDQDNLEMLRANLNLLEEIHKKDRVRMAVYQHRVAWYYNFRVRGKEFMVDDLVLCHAEVSQ